MLLWVLRETTERIVQGADETVFGVHFMSAFDYRVGVVLC